MSSEERDMITRRDTGPDEILVPSMYEVHTSEERDIENIKSMKIRQSYGVLRPFTGGIQIQTEIL